MNAAYQTKNVGIYQNKHTGGWEVEVWAAGEWVLYGIYGTREAAEYAAKHGKA